MSEKSIAKFASNVPLCDPVSLTPPTQVLYALSRLLCGMEPSSTDSVYPEPWPTIIGELGSAPKPQRDEALDSILSKCGQSPLSVRRALANTTRSALAAPLDSPPSAPPTKRYTVHWADEALEGDDDFDWVVAGMFSKGSVSLIVGEGGSKKTYLAIDCAVCVAMGQPWLGFSTTQGTVLYVDEESGKVRLKKRLRAVMRGHRAGRETPVAWTVLEQFNLTDIQDVEHVASLIDEVKPSLVVIDALADAMPGADENSVKDVHPVFQRLRGMAETKQCAVVVLHHANKAGGYRGSTAIKGAVDLMLMVDSKLDSSRIDVTTEKARDIEPLTFSAIAHFDNETEAVWLSPDAPCEKSPHFSKAESYVMRYIRKNGGRAPMASIESNADVCSARTAKNAVYSLTGKGLLRRRDSGGKGQAAIYEEVSLPEEVGIAA